MENIIYIIIIAAVFLFRIISASNKAKGQKRPSAKAKIQPNQSQQDLQRKIFEELGLGELYQQGKKQLAPNQPIKKAPIKAQKKQRKHTANTSDEVRNQTVAEKKVQLKKIRDGYKKPFLNKEIEQAEKGHFSEKEIVEKFQKAHAEGKQLEHHTHDYLKKGDDVYAESFREEFGLGRNRRTKGSKSLNRLIGKKENLRKSFILSEVLSPKYR